MIRELLPRALRRWLGLQRDRLTAAPKVGNVRFGGLRRLEPISRKFGTDRGQGIDRYYIERFLEANSGRIRGRVLEVGDTAYTRKFGGARVERSDVLHAVAGNPEATIVADLAAGEGIPSGAFDAVILTQTLQHIFDVREALRSVHRSLKPGGTLLATVPGISQISRYDMDRWGDFWRFTTLSLRRLAEQVFQPDRVAVRAHGNVLVAAAFLHGLAAQELEESELSRVDPDYELLITLEAVKEGAA
jgi:SAM-dependent methyltransferase